MAPRIKALSNRQILRWARDTAGFSSAEAAEKLGIDEARLAAWEDGDDAPSIPQLRRLADLYKRPLAVFYLQEVPATFQVIRDLRRLPGTGLRRLPPDLVFEWRRATERRELALELLADMGEEPSAFALLAERTEDPEAVGQRVRDALHITDDEQNRWRDQDGRDSLRAWRDRIEAIGTLVFQATRISSDEASGFAIPADHLPVIVVNRRDAPVRRTFSLLHELAHLMLRVGGVSDLDTDASRPPEEQTIEVFCNHVAAAALMPRTRLLSDPRVASHGARATDWSDSEIADLARSFGVGRDALVRRLLTFGRTTADFYARKRAQYQSEYLAQQVRERAKAADVDRKRNMPLETVSNYGRPLVQMILDNYYQDRLSLSEVAGYLGIKTKHIPKLEQMAGTR
jgi:Zn-dependent peptidase ImmA (M78 family)/DNA-binding XRE family transcriptional regulator